MTSLFQPRAKVSTRKTTLSYPIYSIACDPQGQGLIAAGGGGGEGRSGIPNKITLLDASSASLDLPSAGEIDLSRQEDSVQSLGLIRTDKHLVALAGINSSRADQLAGKNEHLCAFKVELTLKDDESRASISSLGRSALFRPPTSSSEDTYQRLLRLSPAEGNRRRLCAVASRGAKTEELIVFNPVKTPPGDSDVITRINLASEAAGLDIAVTPEGAHSICWCTDSDMYEQSITLPSGSRKRPELTPKNPRRILTPETETEADSKPTPKARPKHRSLRFLTSHHVVVLTNLPGQGGARLSIYHVYPTGPATQIFRKSLPSKVKLGTLMDVCALEPDAQGSQQFVIAVAGQDNTVYTYTTDYQRTSDTFGPLSTLSVLRDIHKVQMTALAFEQYVPTQQDTKRSSVDTLGQEPVIRLVTGDVGHTVAVHSWPVFFNHAQDDAKRRRVVATSSSTPTLVDLIRWASISLFVLLIAIGLQLYHSPETMPALARVVVPARAGHDSVPQAVVSEAIRTKHRIRDRLAQYQSRLSNDADYTKGLILHPVESGVRAQVIADKAAYLKDGTKASARKAESWARHWDELSEAERREWRAALSRAGEWAVEEGEALFKGVLFGSYKDFVGGLAAEALGAV